MSRPRSGIGAELVPLVLILASLAGSLGLIVAVHRRASSTQAHEPDRCSRCPIASASRPGARGDRGPAGP